jgi:asparagine synthase (glutamine-hydrolysing)
MCGIAGVLYRDPTRPVYGAVLLAMGNAIAHRGPDAEGFFRAPGIGLVHRRLSIIDLEGGDQPIANENETLQVVFNGEIYNYCRLRDELLAKGHRFRTRSDTEVLLHLYEEHGDDLVTRLRGMFAFALWDSAQRRLLLARDRVGLKPLYVYRDEEKVLFGSELKAILAHPGVDRTLDPAAIEDYLAFGMISGERAIFARTRKLPPAHVLAVSHEAMDRPARRYWQYRIEKSPVRSLDEWMEALDAKLLETVEAHQIADVPVGAFLSGGVDSSLMVAAQASQSAEPVRTFSIGFREHRFNELPYAREVAQQYGTITAEAAGILDELVRYYDEPFADSSAVPTLWLARLARRDVKVVISGDGGDEAFGGYVRYAHDLREARLRRLLPGWLRRHVLGPMAGVWPKADWLPRPLRAKTLLANLSLDPADAYANTLSMCRLPTRRRLLGEELRRQLNGYRPETPMRDCFLAGPPDDLLASMILVDVNTLLPDDFLTKVDRASMSCGLEVRPPLVDHEFLELAGQVPSEWKIRDGQTKWILKRLARNRLPASVIDRPKKGFEIPIDQWLRGPLRETFESIVLAPGARVGGLIDQAEVRTLYESHLSKTGRHGNVLWSLLILARWAEEYLTQRTPAAEGMLGKTP